MSIAQSLTEVKPEYQCDRAELLALADRCLEEHNAARARFLAVGDDAAYIAAMAAKQDREQLLGQGQR